MVVYVCGEIGLWRHRQEGLGWTVRHEWQHGEPCSEACQGGMAGRAKTAPCAQPTGGEAGCTCRKAGLLQLAPTLQPARASCQPHHKHPAPHLVNPAANIHALEAQLLRSAGLKHLAGQPHEQAIL